MSTIEKIKDHGEAAIGKLKAGETLSENDKAALKIYNSLYSKPSPLAGKRRVRNDQGGYSYK